ncbi:MAG: hypothetical protein OXT67_01165 [Zetaproteobacteria bacterium]|nr:hypothetical protein [Zetaproteobacteria bacterium]
MRKLALAKFVVACVMALTGMHNVASAMCDGKTVTSKDSYEDIQFYNPCTQERMVGDLKIHQNNKCTELNPGTEYRLHAQYNGQFVGQQTGGKYVINANFKNVQVFSDDVLEIDYNYKVRYVATGNSGADSTYVQKYLCNYKFDFDVQQWIYDCKFQDAECM